MKIVQFTAENIKKLKVVDITPKGDFIEVTGKNGSGKTSVLDAIFWALAGKEAIQGEPIRQGEEKAVIRLDLGEIIVTRRFTKAGTTLVVESADGFRAPSPQAMLDSLIGHLTFDPLEFSRMEPKKQFDLLRKIADVKIDFEAFAAADKKDTEARRDANRDIKNLEAQISGIVVAADVPDQPVSVDDLMKQLNELEDWNSAVAADELKLEGLKRRLNELGNRKEELNRQLMDVDNQITKVCQDINAVPKTEAKPTTDVKSKIAGAQAVNKAFDEKRRKQTLQLKLDDLREQSDGLTIKMEERQAARIKAVQESKMPIDGLSFGDNEVLFNGLPFVQLSSAEQLRISMAIAMAANPMLRVIRIKDGSLLDDSSLKLIHEAARDRDYQVWCERVDTSGKIGIVMEDGTVAANNQ